MTLRWLPWFGEISSRQCITSESFFRHVKGAAMAVGIVT